MYVDYVRVYQGNDSAFSIAKSGTSETKPTQTTTGDGFTTCSGEKTSLGGWGLLCVKWKCRKVSEWYKSG